MTGPSTEAGKWLLDAIFSDGGMPVDPGAAVIAIEAEARAAVLADLARKVEGLDDEHCSLCPAGATALRSGFVSRAALLDLIREEQQP